MNIIIVCTERKSELFYKKIMKVVDELDHNLIGFAKVGTNVVEDSFLGFPLYRIEEVHSLNYDLVLIHDDLSYNYDIPLERFRTIFWLLQSKISLKYESSNDREIQSILKWWETHNLSVFNYPEFHTNPTFDPIYYDAEADLPYIWFETITGTKKKMYFPKYHDTFFWDGNDGYVVNILKEQYPGSPHSYTNASHDIEDEDVIIDAGVCEGNFALRYIDIASHVYLFEADNKWEKPLYYTFRDFEDRVELYCTALGEKNDKNTIRLDDVIPSIETRTSFLKMDVDGLEVKILCGGKKILNENRIKCSICSYHNSDDEFKIRALLSNCGYKTSTSSGYMLMIHDPNIWERADFRRGVVYGDNL